MLGLVPALGPDILVPLFSISLLYLQTFLQGRYSPPVTEMRPLRPERRGHVPEDAQHKRGQQ